MMGKQIIAIGLNLGMMSCALLADICCPPIVEDCCDCQVCPPTMEITPKAGPCVKNGIDGYITADFIYWTANEDNLEFAMVTGSDVQIGTEALAPKTKIYGLKSHWTPGFKVGAGYDFCFDGWDIGAEYTWLRSTTTRRTSQFLSADLLLQDSYWFINTPNLLVGISNSPVSMFALPDSFASEKWHLAFNVIDLELGRNFYISKRVQFRPYFGLKGTWQTQTLDVDFQGTFVTGAPFFSFFSMSNKIDTWGIGILAGLDGAWHFNQNFSLIGNLALSALWQRFKTSRVDTQFAPSFNTSSSFLNVSEHFFKVSPVLEWMLGLRWESWFYCDRYHVSLDAGWEMQNWFSQNRFVRVPGSPLSGGDLTLQGLTLHARLDF